MKVTLRISSLFFGLALWSVTAWAQPVNNDCVNALPVVYADNEAAAVLVAGDTRGATASTTPSSVCSQTFYTDDIWYYFRTPVNLPNDGILLKAYFDRTITQTDIPSVGFAVYAGCGSNEPIVRCQVTDDPTLNTLQVASGCLMPDTEYKVRVWSGGADATTEGTFKLGIFAASPATPALWVETFAGGIEANGWTTEGTCGVPDSSAANGGFQYLPTGNLTRGAWSGPSYFITSETICDGAVGIDSDFNDNGGSRTDSAVGTGRCAAESQHFLVSPEINTSNWSAIGLSLSWTQAIRNYYSTFFISYRTKDGEDPWTDWVNIEVNQEFPVNDPFNGGNVQRHFLSGASGHDLLQFRFVYNANYYCWAIDDVKILETEANNLRVQRNFYAIAPWASIPSNQVYPFAALADISNTGAVDQTNVVLNHTVVDANTQAVLYNEDLVYGTVLADSTYENRLNPVLIDLPQETADYIGTYTLTQDEDDFDTSDNVISFAYSVGGNTFALENEFTTGLAVNDALYSAGAPKSMACGNYFRPVADATVDRILWGAYNPIGNPNIPFGYMTGQTVQVYLLQWTDDNGDKISQPGERDYIGTADYLFTGSEGEHPIIETTLVNFENEGAPIIMKAGLGYMAIIQYQATFSTDPQFLLMGSDARDYSAAVLAMDTAVAQGLADDYLYTSVLGFSPDGQIGNIDYEVREFGNDARRFFGHNLTPIVRIVVNSTNTVDQLPVDNSVSIYPNPASDLLQVKLDFDKPYSDVKLRLIDNLGRVVYFKALEQTFSQHVESVSVHGLPSGNYLLQVETPDGQRSLPVIVTK